MWTQQRKAGLFWLALAVLFLDGLAVAAPAGTESVRGEYLEVRTSEVYVGACFANSEINTAGKEAVLAWRVRSGDWNRVPLDGLSVVAVIRAAATLGDPDADPRPIRALLFVDARADARQEQALLAMAKAMGGSLLSDIRRVEAVPIQAEFKTAGAYLKVGDVAEVKTRDLRRTDYRCGHSERYYEPLVAVTDAVAGYTEVHEFNGQGLGKTWSNPYRASAFVAGFSR